MNVKLLSLRKNLISPLFPFNIKIFKKIDSTNMSYKNIEYTVYVVE